QPVIFVLLFSYVFGSAIHLPGGGSYHQYLISGMFGMAMAGSAPGTAVALTTDMSTGLIDRFRSLPMSRAAVLAGRTLADLLTQLLGIVVLIATGLAIGWRIHNGIGSALLAVGLSLLFAFAMTWAAVRGGGAWGGRLRRHAPAQPRAGAAPRFHRVPAADVRIERVRADPGHAVLAAGDRRLESDERDRGELPVSLRRRQSGRDHPS